MMSTAPATPAVNPTSHERDLYQLAIELHHTGLDEADISEQLIRYCESHWDIASEDGYVDCSYIGTCDHVAACAVRGQYEERRPLPLFVNGVWQGFFGECAVTLPSQSLTFPSDALVGSLGEFARFMADGSEVPEEFYFAAALTFVGATCGNRLKLNAALNVEPRLFTVLLGESGDVKKSTALRNTAEFFQRIWRVLPSPSVSHGVGSAEGLARLLKENNNVVLCYDELMSFVEKTKIQTSVLLPMTASLFEQNNFENTTKEHALKVEDAHLSLMGCRTVDTYKDMWTHDAIAIGFPNRLFVVSADRRRKVCWPEPKDEAKLDSIPQRFIAQIGKLPLTLGIEAGARKEWERWYEAIPASVHAKRLDAIGFRLLGLIALTTDKTSIDVATVRTVVKILNYELSVRIATDPIDADGKVAAMEESIRRQLGSKGALSERALRQYTNANRAGLWVFGTAVANVLRVGDVVRDKTAGTYRLGA